MGVMCHRKSYLLTKDNINDPLCTEIEQRNRYNTAGMLVNTSVPPAFKTDRT